VTTLWRLARRIHAARESLARGAQLTGGRWNPRGTPVVYGGSSIALVALEYFVHLAGEAPTDLVLLRIEVPDGASAEVLAPSALADGWQEDLAATQRRGREWIDSRRTLLLSVPSAIVPERTPGVGWRRGAGAARVPLRPADVQVLAGRTALRSSAS